MLATGGEAAEHEPIAIAIAIAKLRSRAPFIRHTRCTALENAESHAVAKIVASFSWTAPAPAVGFAIELERSRLKGRLRAHSQTAAMPSTDIRIVCFDLGGVLVRIWRTIPDICRAAGLALHDGWNSETARRAHEELNHLYTVGAIDHPTWAERLSHALGNAYSPSELDRLHHAVTRTEYEGVGALVDELHARAIPTACLSNTTHGHWVRLVHRDGERGLPGNPEYPTVHKLRAHHASHLLGLAKPDPAIYRAFERACGFSGSQILFFDDLPDNVDTARRLGWRAQQVDHEVETEPQLRRALTAEGLL